MRTPTEALKEIRDRLTYFCLRTDGRYDPPWATELVGIIDESVTERRAVGNAPPRQCDIGTAEEQASRMRQFCEKQKRDGIINCGYCQLHQRNCTLTWAQMPYESQEGVEHDKA